MSINCLIIGESGTGKSTSMRNLPPDKTAIIQTVAKPLPFKSPMRPKVAIRPDDVVDLCHKAAQAGKSIIVLDDIQYVMCGEFMARSKERGFDKFTDIGANMWKLLQTSLGLPEHVRIYLLWHSENSDGRVKVKTIGKMIDEKITVEGMFSIVLRTRVQDGQYYFLTNNQGNDTTKSPYGMFPEAMIGNDLAKVDAAICEYYSLSDSGNIAGIVVDGSSKKQDSELLAEAEATFG